MNLNATARASMLFFLAVTAWMISTNHADVAAAMEFTVDSPSDVEASAPLDNGICQTAPNNRTCTLRAAIMKANHTPGGPHTVNVPANLYTLTKPSANTDNEANGALKITASMNIIGAGASTTIIDANGPVTADRGFRIVPGISVNITALTVRNGATTKGGGLANVAGGIYNEGTLTLTRVVVSDSSAELDGGIRNELGALMTLVDCIVTGNKATKMNSAVGGIRNDGTVTLINTTVSSNQTSGPGGGIVNGGQFVMINSTVSGNRSG